MSKEKYYEIFLDENNRISPESITYFTSKHIYNELSKKDSVKNIVLSDIIDNYSYKFDKLFNSLDDILGFTNDDIIDLFNYTNPHLQKILKNPKFKIVKEKKMINKEKLKSIDANTFKWLGTKPGVNIREKLANTDKVQSTVKVFSNDTKENQVVKSFFKKIYSLLLFKFEFMHQNKDVFKEETYIEKEKKLKLLLNKTKIIINDIFADVSNKEHSIPNNTLINNVDYHSIWESYRNLKTLHVDLEYSNNYFRYLFKLVMLCFVNSNEYNVINKQLSLFDDIENCIVYKIDDNVIVEIQFDIDTNMSILINKYCIVDNIYEKTEENEYIFEGTFNSINNVDSRGQYFEIQLDGEKFFESYADLKGTFETLNKFIKFFNISIKQSINKKECKYVPIMASLNSYDNCIYSDSSYSNPHIQMPNRLIVGNDSLYFVDANNIFINSIFKQDYSSILAVEKFNIELGSSDLLIYDVKDTFDEFSSRDIRKKYSVAFPKSYPVWRSILAGESIDDKDNIKYIVDMTGKEYYISSLKRKKGLFVHCGPIDLPPFFDKYSERDFLNNYIELYEEKYDIEFSDLIKSNMRNSGRLFKLLLEKKNQLEVFLEGNHYEHDYYFIKFDDEIFNECLEEFIYKLEMAQEKYPLDNTIYVIPDFLNCLCKGHIISNKSLINGANIIKERVINHKIAWYEQLPNLSLEIINNGYFDNLQLVENQECENIIGKSFGIDVKQDFTLTAGEEEYILPLNKSFLGDQNISFVAKLRDPSFPLKKDTKVRLKLRYSFGSENSYELSFIPIEEAPFKKIMVEWEEATKKTDLVYPVIPDRTYSENYEDELSKFKHLCYCVSRDADLLKKKRFKGPNRVIYDRVRSLANLHQNLRKVENQSLNEKLHFLKNEYSVTDNLKYLHEHEVYEANIESDEKYKRIHLFNIEEVEIALVETHMRQTWFTENYLMFPESCFGRFLARSPRAEDIVEMAYSSLIELSKNDDYLTAKQLRMHFQSLTSATVYNPNLILEVSRVNPGYTLYLLEVVIKLMKEMADYDYNTITEDRVNCPTNNAFTMKFCLEILTSFLYARKLVQFELLLPGNKYANEIIYYLKTFNKKIQMVKDWGRKTPNLASRYRFDIDVIPSNLYNVWKEAYCMILYLSGDENAKLITINMEKNDDKDVE